MRLDHREGQLQVTVVVTFRLTKIFLLFSKHRAWPVRNKEPVLRAFLIFCLWVDSLPASFSSASGHCLITFLLYKALLQIRHVLLTRFCSSTSPVVKLMPITRMNQIWGWDSRREVEAIIKSVSDLQGNGRRRSLGRVKQARCSRLRFNCFITTHSHFLVSVELQRGDRAVCANCLKRVTSPSSVLLHITPSSRTLTYSL